MSTTSMDRLARQADIGQRMATVPNAVPPPAAANNARAPSPVAALSTYLERLKPQMALALPRHMNPDRMMRLALTAFSQNRQLQACTPQSIAASLMTAGQLGLEPGINGAGYLIPYGETCTFVPGWRGLVDLVSRSGLATVFTGVIYSDQTYRFTDGARRDLVIENETDLDAPEDVTHAYAVGWVRGADMPHIELWRVSKIAKHRDKYNKVGMKHYSFRDWEMYARKVPLLQVLKYLPCSVELSNAIAVSNAAEEGRPAFIDQNFLPLASEPSPPAAPADPAPKRSRAPAVKAEAPAPEPKPEPAVDAAPAATYAEVISGMLAARTVDQLDDAALLIGAVSKPDQRTELQHKYDQLRRELEAQEEPGANHG
jgi:recombination protein RecT